MTAAEVQARLGRTVTLRRLGEPNTLITVRLVGFGKIGKGFPSAKAENGQAYGMDTHEIVAVV